MTTGIVTGIIANLVHVEVNGPVAQNEICFIDLDGVKLKAEVIKVQGNIAYTQVFESTRGLKPGSPVEFTQRMLEAKLGPGMLSKIYDGLQDDLHEMEGLFLNRGEYTDPLDDNSTWDFTPIVKEGDSVIAGDWLGEVPENWIAHKIMVPFTMDDKYKVKSIAAKGTYKLIDTIATLEDSDGGLHEVSMVQYWPVKLPIEHIKKTTPL